MISVPRASRPHAKTGFENGVSAEGGKRISQKNKVFKFGVRSGAAFGIIPGLLFERFWEPFGHHFRTLGPPWGVFEVPLRAFGRDWASLGYL